MTRALTDRATLCVLGGFAVLALCQPLSARQAEAARPVAQVNMEQRMLLRCSATFALVADRQQRGEAWALEYPAMAERGREFFVRSGAQVMDDAGIDRATVAQILEVEAQQIWENGDVAAMMPVCLQLLEQSGL